MEQEFLGGLACFAKIAGEVWNDDIISRPLPFFHLRGHLTSNRPSTATRGPHRNKRSLTFPWQGETRLLPPPAECQLPSAQAWDPGSELTGEGYPPPGGALPSLVIPTAALRTHTSQ